jgi:hypothetical protein
MTPDSSSEAATGGYIAGARSGRRVKSSSFNERWD